MPLPVSGRVLRRLNGAAMVALIGVAAPANAAEPVPDQAVRTVDFAADTIDYDQSSDMVTASGNVLLINGDYRLMADKVLWNRQSGVVTAEGQVRAIDADGNIAYGDSITLTDTLRDGAIRNMLLVLADGGRLVAESGTRTANAVTLSNAAYTPCAVENADGCPKDPSWQVKASQVTLNTEKERVHYKNARIELFGLPVVPLPGLTHPSAGAAGSGIIVPDLRYSRNNGLEVALPYYFYLSPNQDLTVTGHAYTKVAPMVSGSYRHVTGNGAIRLDAYGTYSSRIDTTNATSTVSEDRLRGYIAASGKVQIDPHWALSGSLRYASDRTFLRRYDISRDDRLRNTMALERIDQDSYFALSGWAVETLRVGDSQGAAPIALPEIDYRRRIADPLAGGRITLQANTLAIARTEGQDTRRAFAAATWERRMVTGSGQDVRFTLLARGDVYHSDENAQTTTDLYRGLSGWQGRGVALGAVDVSWPLVGTLGNGVQTLTPRIQMVAAPTMRNFEIPNEDARAVDLEDSNLFALNRFPGYDRVEDGPRITYGMDWNYAASNITANATIGQSYRLTRRQSILPDGTGLSDRLSDFVGRVELRYDDLISVTNRFRIDKDDFTLRRIELDATLGGRANYVQVAYLRLNRDIGDELEDLTDREGLRVGGRWQFAPYWSVFGSAIFDLTDAAEDPNSGADGFEPIRTRLGLAYDDDCLSIGFTWRRDYQPTGDALKGDTFLFRLAFRNLGL